MLGYGIEVTMFQFTHPGKGATIEVREAGNDAHVSIHAPWEGCDSTRSIRAIFAIEFQFTHPGKGATAYYINVMGLLIVSIHAPWEGCDRLSLVLILMPRRFQFTHPGKGATSNTLVTSDLFACFNSRTLGRVRQCGAKLRIIGRINKRNLRLGVLS